MVEEEEASRLLAEKVIGAVLVSEMVDGEVVKQAP